LLIMWCDLQKLENTNTLVLL